MNSKFSFKNMDPTSDLQQFANRHLEQLQEAAPYLTTIQAELQYSDGKYTCTLNLYSHWGYFSASSSTFFPEAAIVWSEHKIMSQLWSWKEKRFSALVDAHRFGSPAESRDSEEKLRLR